MLELRSGSIMLTQDLHAIHKKNVSLLYPI